MPAYGVTLGTLPPAAALLSTAVAEEVAGVGLGQAGPSATVGGRALLHEEGVLGAPGLSVGDVGQSTGGLSLSPSMSPIPHRIVSKARSGQFVDMRDFISDNVALLQQLEAFGVQSTGPAFPGAPRPWLRDVSTLPSWLYCFLVYMAVCTGDTRTRTMLAYARLIIREAQRHGGSGWLDYDWAFRQQAALDPSVKWNELHPGIQAATLVGHSSGPVPSCRICREPDHSAAQCALSYTQPQGPARGGDQPDWQSGSSQPPPRLRWDRICASWNSGRCLFPGTCKFRHVCLTCYQPHRAKDYMATPVLSDSKQAGLRQGGRYIPRLMGQ